MKGLLLKFLNESNVRKRAERNYKMIENKAENNWAAVVGTVVSPFQLSHEILGEKFYVTHLEVSRLSGQTDQLPLLVSDRLLDPSGGETGRILEASGSFRSYNLRRGEKSRLMLSLFVQKAEYSKEETEPVNQIYLDGYLCKQPSFRTTPLGREIADLFVAVNRPGGKSDYIPCIAWGRQAREVSEKPVGSHIRLWGRIQSRSYTKKLSENESEARVAYEVSVTKLEILE